MIRSPSRSAPAAAVVGATRNSSALSAVIPTRSSSHQYRPYAASVGTSAATAVVIQNAGSAGGARVPVATATTTSAAVVTTTCTVSVTSTGGRPCDRRSRNVPATRHAIAAAGSRYATGSASAAPACDRTTSTTPTAPSASPAHCAPRTRSPRRGPTSVATTSGCTASMSAVVPVAMPAPIAAYTNAQ